VPEEILESSIHRGHPELLGPVPVRQIAFDVVAVESSRSGRPGLVPGILEENAKMPVGPRRPDQKAAEGWREVFPNFEEPAPVRSWTAGSAGSGTR